MRQILYRLYCLWFGHSYKLIWEDDYVSYGGMTQAPLKKMKCTNCGKEIVIKKIIES